MVAAAPSGGLGRWVTRSGGAWRAGVRRRLCRPAVADLSGRARLQRARGRHDCHGHAGRHRPDDSVGWLDRQPVFPAPAAFDRGRADGRDRGGFRGGYGILAASGHRRCRHDEPSGDASIFVPLEQTVLTETIEPRRRTALFARYSVIGSCATALGVLAAAFPDYATAWTGCSRSTAMQLMFGLYAFLGAGAFLLYRPLSPAVEVADRTPEAPLGPSKKLVYGMAALFGMDSFGTGFLVQSLLALWLYQAFQVSVTTTATILFWSGVCSAISYLVAVPIAERIGLINTMVFTHLPSNILLILTPPGTQPRDCNRAAAGAQRAIADGRANQDFLCDGRRHAARAASRREYYRRPEDLCLGRGFDDFGLPADPFHFRLAIADRRHHQGRL